jgi:uncharacterized integral membrane protein (TIGR00698 family)
LGLFSFVETKRAGHLPGTYPAPTRHLPGTYPAPARHLPGTYPACTRHVSIFAEQNHTTTYAQPSTVLLKKMILQPALFIQQGAYVLCGVLCLSTLVSPPFALFLGLTLALTLGSPFPKFTSKVTKYLLQFSVVCLGLGMNVESALASGKQGLIFTVTTIVVTLALGALLGWRMRIDRKTSYLVATGTAICGGSAIAAVSPIVKANSNQISVSLGIVFILNAIALFVFPFIGEALNLSETQFGMWCAIAIHDTSSVVGAASKYGLEALQVATTVKLTRALWIIPLSVVSATLFKSKGQKLSIPYFIGWFVVAMIANTYLPFVQPYSWVGTTAGKAGLTLTLFLIGSGLSRSAIRHVGVRPFILGTVLWLVVSATSLFVIVSGWL